MTPERAAIERQLEAIFASEAFVSAPKMRALLRYLVEATLVGDADRLKGYAIGIDVFERGTDFDPGTDPIVRVQAGRLRKLLETYYSTTGRDDSVRIEIPKGSYAVDITTGREKPAAGAPAASDDAAAAFPARLKSWIGARGHPLGSLALLAGTIALVALAIVGTRSLIGSSPRPTPATPSAPAPSLDTRTDAITLALLPFTNMSKDASDTTFTDGLTDALTTALARVKSVALASRTSAFQYRKATDLRQVGRNLGVRYVLEGGLQRDGGKLQLNVQLIDTLTGAHVWAQTYDRNGGDNLAVQSELVTTLAAELRPQLFGAAKRAIEAAPAQQTTAWQLYMQSTWMPGEARNSLAWEKERVQLARKALKLDPNLGQAHSVLADKLSYLANVDPPSDTEEARTEAEQHAQRTLELASGDADAVFNVSIHYWHSGGMAESLDMTRRTLELDPNHVLARFLVKAVPYTCAETPQSVIDELAAFDAAMSPDSAVRWLTLYWLSRVYLNNNDLAKAREAAQHADQIYRSPDSFYQLAAILVQLGETKAALAQIDQQRENWPNLDPRHYANVAVPRRCGNAPKAGFLHRVYSDLADAVEAAGRAH